MDARHQGKAHLDLTQSVNKQLLERPFCCSNKETMVGLHRLGIFELNKIYNGAVYTDSQHLNCLLLRFSRGVANYNPAIYFPAIYIAFNP